MKRILMTAAALTLGTSALAWAPAQKMESTDSKLLGAKSEWSDKSASMDKLASWQAPGKVAVKNDAATMQMASLDTKWDEAKLDTAAMDMSGKTKPDVQTASLETKPDWTGKETGMGGPLETAEKSTETMITGYPPCDPGPGDDRCIQLYERGVTQALAQWKGSEAEVAMGGPFEPVADADKAQGHQGMSHGTTTQQSGAGAHGTMTHGSGHAGHGATAETQTGSTDGKPAATAETDAGAAIEGKPAATEADMDANAGTKPTGVGGPFEPAASYPPCRPGPGDDRCIQLYERGVSGRKD